MNIETEAETEIATETESYHNSENGSNGFWDALTTVLRL
jgi:hypothetical protein